MAFRCPIFRNGPSDDLNARVALDIAEILSRIAMSYPWRMNQGLAAIDKNLWREVRYGKSGAPNQNAFEKSWDRIKKDIRDLGFEREVAELWFDPDIPQFVFDARVANAWSDEARKLGDESKLGGRQRRVDISDHDLTVDQAAVEFGVGPKAVYEWVALGAPHERVVGSKGYGDIRFDKNELSAWVATRSDQSRRFASYHEERVPSQDAAAKLMGVRNSLGLTTRELARRLGVDFEVMDSWVHQETDTIPLSVMIKLQIMADENGLDLEEVKGLKKEIDRIPREEAAPRLRAAQKAVNASISVFADMLGVPAVTLKSWFGTGGKKAASVPIWAVESAEELARTVKPRILRSAHAKLVDIDDLKTALQEAHGSASKAAEILGVAKSSVVKAARELGLETKKQVVLTDFVSREALQDQLEKADGNAAKAGRHLGVDRGSVVRLAAGYVLSHLVRSGRGYNR